MRRLTLFALASATWGVVIATTPTFAEPPSTARVGLASGTESRGAPSTSACTDAFDPNECPNATHVGAGTYTDLKLPYYFINPNDEDDFIVHVRRSQRLTATMTTHEATTSAEIWVLQGCFGTLLAATTGPGLTHTVTWDNNGPDADFCLTLRNYDSAICHTYDLTITLTATVNLNNFTTYPGWSAPVVVRNDNTATLASSVNSTFLDGNATNTYVTWSIVQTGPYNSPAWNTYAVLDGDPTPLNAMVGDACPPGNYYVPGNIAIPVRGGRHTVTAASDNPDNVPETNDGDNSYFVQRVWSPLVTSRAVPNVRITPPAQEYSPIENMDGFSFTRSSNYAWVVSEAGFNPGDDYDLRVANDYVNSGSGFSNFISGSGYISNAVDFVVGHFSGTPTTVYPGVRRFRQDGGGGSMAVDQTDATGRNSASLGSDDNWENQTLAANRLADVFEAYMLTGQNFKLSLRRISGPSDLTFYVHPGTAGGVYSRGGGSQQSSPIGASIDVLTYTATEDGWHPIVVCRDVGTNADQPVVYNFYWNKTGLVDAPIAEVAQKLEFIGVTPNPIHASGGTFEFELPVAGTAALKLYDVNGRLVREIASGTYRAGAQHVAWDGRGAGGLALRAGMYWAQLDAAGKRLTKRVVVVQ